MQNDEFGMVFVYYIVNTKTDINYGKELFSSRD
jgi:hypothetical protein